MASIYLARHGQTAYNLEGRFQGHLPVPLDGTGRAQALELAQRAAARDFAALWCSPLLRARETADVVAHVTGLGPREDARLAETDAGDWTDRSFAEVRSEAPDAFAAFLAGDAAFAFPGGESLAHQQQRVGAALADIQRGELPALVICHGMVIRAALSWRAGRWLTHTERVPNGALVPLDPAGAERTEPGSGAATQPS
ncbi:MAG: histidine phosphatase family protein [Actinobacteria bacterium]|nr:MAG: histidine phosphatase family protein [Actinomycetota bacterium]